MLRDGDARRLLDVLKAYRDGDFTSRLQIPRDGIAREIAKTLNEIIAFHESRTIEFRRVAGMVGREGKLGERAVLGRANGDWSSPLSALNSLLNDLTRPMNAMTRVIGAVANGDLSQRMDLKTAGQPLRGEFLHTAMIVNGMVERLGQFASEVTRVAREVGTEGKLGGQARVKGVAGTWKNLTDSVNFMAANLTAQVRNIVEVTTAVAKGNLSRKITVDVKGEILALKNTINTMVDQLGSFASEVTRVAREVGTEGKLGGQAQVKGVAGTWEDLTNHVNSMAANLTTQVRGIAKVVTAVANGDLKRKLILEAKGEIAELAETINGMIDTLALFADQVTSVAREVGIEGKLGGQARVPGAAGIWRHLTDNVNQLAANLTAQVRAIADVATAVTEGDLSRSIAVEAQGEVAALKDNINEMIRNLKETTLKNTEQDWLKTNLTKFTRMLQGQRDLLNVSQLVLSELAPLVQAQAGVFYVSDVKDHESGLKLTAAYARGRGALAPPEWLRKGEGLIGQCAVEKEVYRLSDVPSDYVRIGSGLGATAPRNVVIFPALFEGEVKAVVELASLRPFSEVNIAFLEQLMESIGIVINTIAATTRTEELLAQSQALTEELRETNRRLEQQNIEVEQKNREVEQARVSLEEKAAQLALTSKYKSQFLANTSHELRTPLNSLLILSQLLAENAEGNLTAKQVEFAKTIRAAGSDLLDLINDILDLSKIESGTMILDIGAVAFTELEEYIEKAYRHVATAKNLEFKVEIAPGIPAAITTDYKRLQQILKNLLSNAFKFTEHGSVSLVIGPPPAGWEPKNEAMRAAHEIVAMSVRDTGIGISKDKQEIIFEAFQQADGTTNRKYGGTGLGLSISRELARLLGGELRLESVAGEGSVFTLFLPFVYAGAAPSSPPSVRPAEKPAAPAAEESAVPGFLGASATNSDETEIEIADDRASIQKGDRVALIIEDDADLNRTFAELARSAGFKILSAARASKGIVLAKEFEPAVVVLDINLPDANGWTLLDRIKHDLATRHIPVYVVSAGADFKRTFQLGAKGFLRKPATKKELVELFRGMQEFVERRKRRLLLVEADKTRRDSILNLVGNGDIETTVALSGREAIEALAREVFDCVVLDPDLPDEAPAKFLREMGKARGGPLPVILYGNGMADAAARKLEEAAPGALVRGVDTPERLVDRALLWLHRPQKALDEPRRRIVEKASALDADLAGKHVLIVDDDVRNIFALTTILERAKMRVSYAESGRQALEILEKASGVEIVLMDIMMPGMDGYETMRAIRRLPRWRELPIVALTAKAMKEDRRKCIEAGATDYIAKPVEREQLFSLIRLWLARENS